MGGASLAAVQKLMGHQSIRMTLRYAHLAPDYMKREVTILDAISGKGRKGRVK